MSDYDYCEKHDTSFLMPELLMCPKCAIERLRSGAVDEPLGDALIEAFDTLEKQARAADAQAEKLANALRDTINMVDAMRHLLDQQRMLRLCAALDAIAAYDATKGTK